MTSCSRPSSEAGNVLFLILIAVALFAALSFAVTTSTRQGSSNGADHEKAHLMVSQFTQYAASLNIAIMRLRFSGCNDTQLSFQTAALAHPTLWGGSTNPAAPANGSCHVFGQNGVTFVGNFQGNANRPTVSSTVGVDKIGTDASDIILWLAIGEDAFSKKVCDAFNKAMGNVGSATGGTIRTLSWGWAVGAFTSTTAPVETIGEDGGPALQGGKHAGCIDSPTSHDGNNRYLYQVLLSR